MILAKIIGGLLEGIIFGSDFSQNIWKNIEGMKYGKVIFLYFTLGIKSECEFELCGCIVVLLCTMLYTTTAEITRKVCREYLKSG